MTESGVINLYKPPGITSHKAVKEVQKILKAKKAGHTGTLDPFAEGVLLVCINQATRISEYLTGFDKEYLVTAQLGLQTDTFDITGKVIKETDPGGIKEDDLKAVLENFRGEIEQIPPLFSAIKKNGIPLYKYARKGITVELKPRLVNIYEIELVKFNLPYAIIRVSCSKGTYIRSLIHDIGRELLVGATVKELKRIAIGKFHIKEADTIESIKAGQYHLYSLNESLSHLPFLLLNNNQLRLAVNGTGFAIDKMGEPGDIIRLLDRNGNFIGIGRIAGNNFLKIQKIIKDNKKT
ncbi:MAG: tRNA pseudouridine(55) synthase TruB [Nitrospirae bacterium]|nr:tRNA pseudouridine(55) synthase TruB [Nitrospirota bacterium]